MDSSATRKGQIMDRMGNCLLAMNDNNIRFGVLEAAASGHV